MSRPLLFSQYQREAIRNYLDNRKKNDAPLLVSIYLGMKLHKELGKIFVEPFIRRLQKLMR